MGGSTWVNLATSQENRKSDSRVTNRQINYRIISQKGLLLAIGILGILGTFSPPIHSQSISSPKENPKPKTRTVCPADINALVPLLLRDLPSYANRVQQRARRLSRSIDIPKNYVIIAGQPEFEPLTLGPGAYTSDVPATISQEQPQQIFVTTLERQYVDKTAVELQHYHWLFLTQTSRGWTLVMMFSRIGSYPAKQPPTPPRDSSNGIIAEAIRLWLRDCRAGSIRPLHNPG